MLEEKAPISNPFGGDLHTSPSVIGVGGVLRIAASVDRSRDAVEQSATMTFVGADCFVAPISFSGIHGLGKRTLRAACRSPVAKVAFKRGGYGPTGASDDDLSNAASVPAFKTDNFQLAKPVANARLRVFSHVTSFCAGSHVPRMLIK